jgi:hypothetical protein
MVEDTKSEQSSAVRDCCNIRFELLVRLKSVLYVKKSLDESSKKGIDRTPQMESLLMSHAHSDIAHRK